MARHLERKPKVIVAKLGKKPSKISFQTGSTRRTRREILENQGINTTHLDGDLHVVGVDVVPVLHAARHRVPGGAVGDAVGEALAQQAQQQAAHRRTARPAQVHLGVRPAVPKPKKKINFILKKQTKENGLHMTQHGTRRNGRYPNRPITPPITPRSL